MGGANYVPHILPGQTPRDLALAYSCADTLDGKWTTQGGALRAILFTASVEFLRYSFTFAPPHHFVRASSFVSYGAHEPSSSSLLFAVQQRYHGNVDGSRL